MMNTDKLFVNPKITTELLKNSGFKNGTFKCFIFKDIIQFVVHVDVINKQWYYEVFDTDTMFLYPAYYNRMYGKNEVVNKIDGEIEKILEVMINEKILVNGEQ